MGIEKEPGYLILEDGHLFNGCFTDSANDTSPAIGEVVFNTAMSGYQEVLYDPSYRGQIVVMTVPHVGNTGINPDDEESKKVYLSGFAARSFEEPSSWRSRGSLKELLRAQGTCMFEDLDTRAVTRYLREKGSLRGGFFPKDVPVGDALNMVREHPPMSGCNGALEVTCDEPYDWNKGSGPEWLGNTEPVKSEWKSRVAVLDYGVKQNILRRLVDSGCLVKVFPCTAGASDVEDYRPDGILLSNGPGDPAAVDGALGTIRHFLGKLPIFGICLGHQLLALANGGLTYKMKFGHRGINHPVGLDAYGRVYVTVQNHGFAVSDDPLPSGSKLTFRSLNDGTVEGLEYPDLDAFSVQYHPEASPGPHDASDLFTRFREIMERHAGKN